MENNDMLLGSPKEFYKNKIRITSVTNIVDNSVVDNDLVEAREYDAYMDVFHLFDTIREKHRSSNLMGISIYDDLIIFNEVSGDVQYKVLHMLTKSSEE